MKEGKSFESQSEKPEKKGVMQRIRDFRKAIIFIALAELITPAFLSGAEKAKESVKGMETETSFVENAQKNLSKVTEYIRKKGREIQTSQGPAREWRAKGGDRVMVGFDKADSSKVAWMTSETEDAGRCFLDSDADGKLDRFIANGETGNSALEIKKKSLDNHSNAFVPMAELANYAGTMADMHPEKIKIYEFEAAKNDSVIISGVNLETGEAYTLEGDDATLLRDKVMRLYRQAIIEYGKEAGK